MESARSHSLSGRDCQNRSLPVTASLTTCGRVAAHMNQGGQFEKPFQGDAVSSKSAILIMNKACTCSRWIWQKLLFLREYLHYPLVVNAKVECCRRLLLVAEQAFSFVSILIFHSTSSLFSGPGLLCMQTAKHFMQRRTKMCLNTENLNHTTLSAALVAVHQWDAVTTAINALQFLFPFFFSSVSHFQK